jgi:formylglycine-generating enzyme required for sulfatase activity
MCGCQHSSIVRTGSSTDELGVLEESRPAPVQRTTAAENQTEGDSLVALAQPGRTVAPLTPIFPAMALIYKRFTRTAQFFVQQLSPTVGLDMVLIPGGSFLMGSPENEINIDDEPDFDSILNIDGNSVPQHSVTVSSFCMGKYPITQVQWRVVAGFPEIERELNPEPSRFKGDERPVEQVSWEEAVEFCARLSQFASREYRLPSEAEWEYACRAGTTTPFHYGETITTDLANYDGSSTYGRGPKGVYRKETTPVGSFPANAFGLYDMHGNVWEWCLDHWHGNYAGAPTDGSAWLSEEKGSGRLLRGGSWYGDPRYCRSAVRSNYAPDDRSNFLGFRVVCVAARTL